jgi:hypothetical protein
MYEQVPALHETKSQLLVTDLTLHDYDFLPSDKAEG